jgi:hypothetical protein
VIARQSVGATGNFNERAKDIAGNREWLKLQNGFLWPSEIKRFDNLISERKVILSKDIVASLLAEMKKLDASASTIGKISEGLRTNAQYIQDLSASEKAALNRDLAIKLNELLALQERDPARLMPVPTFLADLKTLDAIVAARDEVAIRETRERISRVLAIMLGKALPEMDNFAPTLDGFASFAGWQAEIRNKYEPFPAYDPVKRAQAQLTEKANALGPVVQTALREELTERTIEELFVSYLEGPGVDDFVRVRSKLAGIEGSLKNPVVSGPLWEEYEIAVSRWMQKAVDAAPRVPQAPTAANRTVSAAPDQSPLGGLERLPGARVQSGGSNGFLSSNLSEPRVVSAIHRKDFGSIYKDDPARVGGYLIYLQKGVQDRCPGVMSTADKRAAMREAFGIDLADLSGERVSKLGLEAAKSFLNKLMNPAELIRDSLQEQEFSDKGDRDAQYLAEAVGCSPATWQGFFTNMIAYFRDRTDGMNPDDLTLTDLCARQATAKFCSCAGPAMETSLTGIQQKFVRVNAKTNIAIARKLLPRMDGALRKCG